MPPHYLTLNVSETVQYRSINGILTGTYTRPITQRVFRMTSSDLE